MAALAFAGLWVGLTAATGATYHLAPVIVAAMPGVVARAEEREIPSSTAFAIGVAAALAGWIAIVALGAEPSVTLVPDQPGGVGGEVVVATAVGALIGARLALLPQRNR